MLRNFQRTRGRQGVSGSSRRSPPFQPFCISSCIVTRKFSCSQAQVEGDKRKLLPFASSRSLDVKVSEGTLDRALLVMARVLVVLERQDARVEISEQGRTTAFVKGEHVSFGIEEPIQRVVTQKPRVSDSSLLPKNPRSHAPRPAMASSRKQPNSGLG